MGSPLNTLPTEVLLEIIPHVPFTRHSLACLRLTCRRLNHVVHTHEQTLIKAVKQRQFTTTDLVLFPGLSEPADCCLSTITISSSPSSPIEAGPGSADDEKPTVASRSINMALPHAHLLGPRNFKELATYVERLDNLEQVHGQWLKIVNHGLELHWLKGRWETIHKAGLLLLYRVQDATRDTSTSAPSAADSMESYIAKTELLHSLPAPSLACLLFKLLSSIKILHVYGPAPINSAWNRDTPALRSDVELACEELLLRHGPPFFTALLRAGDPANASATEKWKSEWAVAALHRETKQVLPRQLPYASGEPKPPTLICSLRRALAWKIGCAPPATGTKMWEILSSGAFDEIGDEGLVGLVVGLDRLANVRRPADPSLRGSRVGAADRSVGVRGRVRRRVTEAGTDVEVELATPPAGEMSQ
nr:hypothetical protein CFP56_31766 [Quercus suber]